MFKTFNFSILGRDIILGLSSIENNSERKEWYRAMSLISDDLKFEKAWRALRNSNRSIIISTCPVTDDIIIQGLVDIRKLDSDNNYLTRLSIEITDQLLETIDKGLSSHTYEVVSVDGITTVLDVKVTLISEIISYLVDFLEEEENFEIDEEENTEELNLEDQQGEELQESVAEEDLIKQNTEE